MGHFGEEGWAVVFLASDHDDNAKNLMFPNRFSDSLRQGLEIAAKTRGYPKHSFIDRIGPWLPRKKDPH